MYKAEFGTVDFTEIEDVSFKIGLLSSMLNQFYESFDLVGVKEASRIEFGKILLFAELIDSFKREIDDALETYYAKMREEK